MTTTFHHVTVTLNPSMAGIILIAGALNWFTTLVLVEGFIFKKRRERVKFQARRLAKWCLKCPSPGFMRRNLGATAQKMVYFVECHLCMGTWVGFVLASFMPVPVHIPAWGATTIVNGLLFKAVGHMILEKTSTWRELSALRKQERLNAEQEGMALRAQAKIVGLDDAEITQLLAGRLIDDEVPAA